MNIIKPFSHKAIFKFNKKYNCIYDIINNHIKCTPVYEQSTRPLQRKSNPGTNSTGHPIQPPRGKKHHCKHPNSTHLHIKRTRFETLKLRRYPAAPIHRRRRQRDRERERETAALLCAKGDPRLKSSLARVTNGHTGNQ